MTSIDWSFIPVPIANFLGFLLILSSLSGSLLRSGNIPVLTIMGVTTFMLLAVGVQSLVWHGNVDDKAPIWCDIGKYSVPHRSHSGARSLLTCPSQPCSTCRNDSLASMYLRINSKALHDCVSERESHHCEIGEGSFVNGSTRLDTFSEIQK